MSRAEDPPDARRFAPATVRNREPIAAVLREVFAALPDDAVVLEIASGSGEHALHFAREFPHLEFQPSDPDPAALASIDAWRESEGPSNLRPALRIDVTEASWHEAMGDADGPSALFCANMIHIAPWEACEGLWRGAGRTLPPGALAVLYGPFRIGGEHTAPSNAAFDESLRGRDPRWGVRDLERVEGEARSAGFELVDDLEMPANNRCLVFRRTRA